jgi:hypothetical protein
MNISKLREKYPDPVTLTHAQQQNKNRDETFHETCNRENLYCIAGTLTSLPFPSIGLVTATIMSEANQDQNRAREHAKRILEQNDQGHFEEAWNTLRSALNPEDEPSNHQGDEQA